jgi:DNA modification methylase
MEAVVNDAGLTLYVGDCRDVLPTLPAASVQCVVTSPPYWGLRDYGTATWDGGDPACDHKAGSDYGEKSDTNRGAIRGGPFKERCGKCGARRIDQQLGLEATPEEYVARMVAVFREVRRVLRDDGTLWLNMGDSYASGEVGRHDNGSPACDDWDRRKDFGGRQQTRLTTGLKPKDLVGIPWRLAFALQANGWFLRSDIVWSKPNPMPESVTDRPTKAHEYVFLLSKAARYYYDADAVREPAEYGFRPTKGGNIYDRVGNGTSAPVKTPGVLTYGGDPSTGRNLRSVWTIPSAPFPDAHFATFPPALASRCIQAGSSAKGCCRACGAPWARQVERARRYDHVTTLPGKQAGGPYAAQTGNGAGTHDVRHGVYSSATTTGWQPSCSCTACPPVPCTVLDPFAGSGTVGMVAEQLGRHATLIELSPTYTQMARTRTAQRGLFTAAGP